LKTFPFFELTCHFAAEIGTKRFQRIHFFLVVWIEFVLIIFTGFAGAVQELVVDAG